MSLHNCSFALSPSVGNGALWVIPLRKSSRHVNVHNFSRQARGRVQLVAGSEFPGGEKSDQSSVANVDNEGGVESGYGSALYRFTRPHTIRGTIIGSFAGCLRALLENAPYVDFSLLPRALLGLLALLFGNAFIVGINQIYDVRIDKVNKPFLPLASGEMSWRLAWTIVLSCGICGLSLVRLYFSRLIFWLYSFGMLIGGLYSLPPFRFKRYPILAALTISCVRGFLMNFGVYHATTNALGIGFEWSAPITFLALFMSVFACVIAIAKDLPDISGDTQAGVKTFASRAGTENVVRLVVRMLMVNYFFAMLVGVFSPPGELRRTTLLVGHGLLAIWLSRKAALVKPNERGSIKSFYKFIWTLFYAEYLLFPFI